MGEIILKAMRWCCKYGITCRELEENVAERGVAADRGTIYRRVLQCAPEMKTRLKCDC